MKRPWVYMSSPSLNKSVAWKDQSWIAPKAVLTLPSVNVCPSEAGFPDSSAGEELACNAGDPGSIPGLGRSPGEGKGYPLQYSSLENSMDSIVLGITKSRTWRSNFHSLKHQWTHSSFYLLCCYFCSFANLCGRLMFLWTLSWEPNFHWGFCITLFSSQAPWCQISFHNDRSPDIHFCCPLFHKVIFDR